MRVTNQMMTESAIRHMSSNLEAINKLQEKVYNNKSFLRPSDNPAASSLSLKLNSSLTTLQSYQDTAANANDWMSATDYAFGQMEDTATRAINLVTSGLNDTMGADERKNDLGTELDGLIQQALETANSSEKGQYIFSGYQINTKPFSIDTDGNLVYSGDSGAMVRNLGPGQTVTVNTQGDQAFQPLMKAMMDARDALDNNDTDALRDSLDALQKGLDNVTTYRSANGARMRQVDQVSDYLDQSKTQMKSLLSENEDINMAEGIAMLNSQQTTYQAVIEVSQRAISALSLFDYLS